MKLRTIHPITKESPIKSHKHKVKIKLELKTIFPPTTIK